MQTQRLIQNARNLNHSTQTAAFAISLCGQPCQSLCCWCAESVQGEAHRLPQGGECSRCSYVGPDAILVLG